MFLDKRSFLHLGAEEDLKLAMGVSSDTKI